MAASVVLALVVPPPDSWLGKLSATFRVLACLIAVPIVTVTALDIASYLIVRTLGPPFAVAKPVPDTDPALDTSPSTHLLPLSPSHTEPHFSYSHSATALSGADVFSPAPSRAITPPPSTADSVRRRRPNLTMTSTVERNN